MSKLISSLLTSLPVIHSLLSQEIIGDSIGHVGRIMETIHNRLEEKGKLGAIPAGANQSVIEVAATYFSDEDSGLEICLQWLGTMRSAA